MRETLPIWALVCLVGGCEAADGPKIKLGLSAAEHEAFFPISAGFHALLTETVQGPMSCDSCHGGTSTFKQFKCIECHTLDTAPTLTSAHAKIPGFIPQNLNCLTCHPTGDRGDSLGVDVHSELFFPINPTDSHGGAAFLARVGLGDDTCTSCHASEQNLALARCADCHLLDAVPIATVHAGLARSFSRVSDQCKRCHGETPVSPAVRPITNHASFYDHNHHEAICANCHEASRAAPKDWTIEFGIATCTGCHNHGPECSPANQGACL